MHPNELTINDYVDGASSSAERTTVEQHLASCVACRQLVDDLRDVRRRAGALEPLQPPARAWSRIEHEIRREQGTGRKRRTAPYWLAAAAILLLATVVGVRVLRPTPAVPASDTTPAQSVESELLQAEQHYQKAITGLEQIANAEKGALDPQTAATLQKNLSVIDQAINESRTALKTQPTSEPAQQSLLESFKTKISLLQDTVALINEMRKGNDAGAARIVSGIKQQP